MMAVVGTDSFENSNRCTPKPRGQSPSVEINEGSNLSRKKREEGNQNLRAPTCTTAGEQQQQAGKRSQRQENPERQRRLHSQGRKGKKRRGEWAMADGDGDGGGEEASERASERGIGLVGGDGARDATRLMRSAARERVKEN
jgi:hypothetical protein